MIYNEYAQPTKLAKSSRKLMDLNFAMSNKTNFLKPTNS